MKEKTAFETAEFALIARRENALTLINALDSGIVPRVVDNMTLS